MSWVETLKESLPEYAKDIKLNLDAVINRSTVDSHFATHLALAAAFATGNGKLIAFIASYQTIYSNPFFVVYFNWNNLVEYSSDKLSTNKIQLSCKGLL